MTSSVALTGGFAAVGRAAEDTPLGEAAGAVHLFSRTPDGWDRGLPRIIGWNHGPFDFFGRSVAFADDWLVVGAPTQDGGFVYFIHREDGEWRPRWMLAAPPDAVAFFGDRIIATTDLVLVGCGPGSGPRRAVYAYRRHDLEWHSDGMMSGDHPFGQDHFGMAFAYSPETGLAAVSQNSQFLSNGTVLVYQRITAGDGPSRWHRRTVLTNPVGPSGGSFGSSVAVSGFTVLVGEPRGGPLLLETGAAHVFEADAAGTGWSHRQTLRQSDPAAGDWFGSFVAISGRLALVGAIGDDGPTGPEHGCLYAFEKSAGSWNETQKMVADPGERLDEVVTDGDSFVSATAAGVREYRRSESTWRRGPDFPIVEPSAGDQFGSSVAVVDNLIAVGARDDDPGSTDNAGAVYVFERDGRTWAQRTRLVPTPAPNGLQFGTAVAAGNGVLVVGGPSAVNSVLNEPGRAFVFTGGGGVWAQRQVLRPPDLAGRQDLFGCAVAMDTGTLVVGARLADTTVERGGAAYVYTQVDAAWGLQTVLTAPDSSVASMFGAAVAISRDTIVVGAPQRDSATGVDTGAAYVFTRSSAGWTLQALLTSSSSKPNDRLGFSVAIRGDVVAAGAPGRSVLPATSGRGHVFERSSGQWTESTVLSIDGAPLNTRIGSAVHVLPDAVLVGVPGRSETRMYRRSAGGWSLSESLAPMSPDIGFGGSIASKGDVVAVGAPSAQTAAGLGAGTVCVFTLTAPTDHEPTARTPQASYG